jgi:hypothetical protein
VTRTATGDIHRRNLIAQGIVPLVFAEEADAKRAPRGQTWQIVDIRTALERGVERVLIRVHDAGLEFPWWRASRRASARCCSLVASSPGSKPVASGRAGDRGAD